MKELGKISVGMLKRLSKKEIAAYKQTNDFETFKEILYKYRLIK